MGHRLWVYILHYSVSKCFSFDFKKMDGGEVIGNSTFTKVKGIGKLKVINSERVVVILTCQP